MFMMSVAGLGGLHGPILAGQAGTADDSREGFTLPVPSDLRPWRRTISF